MAIEYIEGLVSFIVKCLKNGILPNLSPNPLINWLDNTGYFYDKSDNMVVFPTIMDYSKSEIKPEDLKKLGNQFFKLVRYLLMPTHSC